eukprot:1153791-Pelagomonas_calceolata.AAC.2
MGPVMHMCEGHEQLPVKGDCRHAQPPAMGGTIPWICGSLLCPPNITTCACTARCKHVIIRWHKARKLKVPHCRFRLHEENKGWGVFTKQAPGPLGEAGEGKTGGAGAANRHLAHERVTTVAPDRYSLATGFFQASPQSCAHPQIFTASPEHICQAHLPF